MQPERRRITSSAACLEKNLNHLNEIPTQSSSSTTFINPIRKQLSSASAIQPQNENLGALNWNMIEHRLTFTSLMKVGCAAPQLLLVIPKKRLHPVSSCRLLTEHGISSGRAESRHLLRASQRRHTIGGLLVAMRVECGGFCLGLGVCPFE